MVWGLGASEWSAVGTVATAIIALLAALFAAAQVREARRAREDRTRPFVVVDLVPHRTSTHILSLAVENIGQTLARDVKLTFVPPLETTFADDSAIEHSSMVNNGIPSMPPGRRLEGIFDSAIQRSESDLPAKYEVTVEVSDAKGRRQEPLTYILDLAPLFGLTFTREFGIHHVAEALRNIDKRTKQWTRRSNALSVWVRDGDREIEGDRGEHVLTGSWPSLATKTPPDAFIALARNPFIRLLLDSIPPLRRFVQARLG